MKILLLLLLLGVIWIAYEVRRAPAVCPRCEAPEKECRCKERDRGHQ